MNKLKVFGHVWHLGHQHELLKLAEKYPVEFTFIENNVKKWTRTAHRGIPEHLNWAQTYEKGKYDLAILHLDQQCVNPDVGKGWLYKDLNHVVDDIPKIVVMHGTPDYQEVYDESLVINGGEVHTKQGKKHLEGIKEMVGDNAMVVNSYEAVNRWGWGYPIIHGMDPDEWYDLDKEPRVTMTLTPGGLDHYYNRRLISDMKKMVYEKSGYEFIHTTVRYEPKDFRDYREFIGSSLLHAYPFWDSPMPRARTEAMLSGACVLSSRHHNADEFIENGVNGFIVPDNPLSYAETIDQLINYHYEECVEIGQRAKETAMKYFHIDSYLDDWWELINKVLNKEKIEWDGSKRWT